MNPVGIGENDIADANNGNVKMQYKIAQTYYEKGMHAHARAWANKLVAKGHVMSIVLLGQLHFEGNDVHGLSYHPPERDTTEKLFGQACQKDQIKVPLVVAEYYQKRGMSQKAVKFYTIAGENGNLKAQVWLGDYYVAYGLDQRKALEWFEKSAAQGHALSIQSKEVEQ